MMDCNQVQYMRRVAGTDSLTGRKIQALGFGLYLMYPESGRPIPDLRRKSPRDLGTAENMEEARELARKCMRDRNSPFNDPEGQNGIVRISGDDSPNGAALMFGRAYALPVEHIPSKPLAFFR